MAWHPSTYLAFANHRTRPAYELIARIPVEAPRIVHDLGCGPGNSAQALAERWPDARLTGVDNSREMLAAARTEGPAHAEWQFADVATWTPEQPSDLIFSNATFQWIPRQEVFLPRLFHSVAKGGAFAFQIPANQEGPPHTLIDQALHELGLLSRIDPASLSRHVLSQHAYYQLLAADAAAIDIWDTEYLQVLRGADAVLNWIKGTALVPIMEMLDASESRAFMEQLRIRLNTHYPQELRGETLFPFRRRFIVALRG